MESRIKGEKGGASHCMTVKKLGYKGFERKEEKEIKEDKTRQGKARQDKTRQDKTKKKR